MHLKLTFLTDQIFVLSFEFFDVSVVQLFKRAERLKLSPHRFISYMIIVPELLKFKFQTSISVISRCVFLLFKPQLFDESVLLLSQVRHIFSIVAGTLVSDLSFLVTGLLLVLQRCQLQRLVVTVRSQLVVLDSGLMEPLFKHLNGSSVLFVVCTHTDVLFFQLGQSVGLLL